MAQLPDPFRNYPDLRPTFIPDNSGTFPFKGFSFLEGVVRLDETAGQFTKRQIQCMGRTILGQTNPEIATRLGVTPQTVFNDLQRVHAFTHTNARASIFSGALRTGLLSIVEYGPTDMFPVTPKNLDIIGLISSGKTDKEIGLDAGHTQHGISEHLARITRKVGFSRRELLVAGAIVTGQIDYMTDKPYSPQNNS
jgi:DNA-binding CsgD family transcriptional regulator